MNISSRELHEEMFNIWGVIFGTIISVIIVVVIIATIIITVIFYLRKKGESAIIFNKVAFFFY